MEDCRELSECGGLCFLPLPVGEGRGEQLCLKSTADD